MNNINTFDIQLFYKNISIVKELSKDYLTNYESILDILDSILADFKRLLSIDIPANALDNIDDLINYDDITGWMSFIQYCNRKDKSYLHAVLMMTRYIQDSMLILYNLSVNPDIEVFDINDFDNNIYRLDELMTISREMIKNRIKRKNTGEKLGNQSIKLNGILNATTDYLLNIYKYNNMKTVLIENDLNSFHELVWRNFSKYSSENQLCNGKYEIYVDGDVIVQESNNRLDSISKKTYSNYITEANKIAKATLKNK